MCQRGQGRLGTLGFLQLMLLPAFFLVARAQDDFIPLVTSVSGSNVSLHITGLPSYTSLTWMFSEEQKILNLYNGGLFYYETKFSGRVKLGVDATLYIYNVQKEDSSVYILRLTKPSSEEVEKKIELQVFDPVHEPTIKIKSSQLRSFCFLKLSCVVPDANVKYNWFGDLDREDPRTDVLEVTLEQNMSGSYTCQVSNPVSKQNKTIKYNPPCKSGESSRTTWVSPSQAVLWLTLLIVLLA
ncbi:CD48 antigen-like [Erinaceus europaeus]|uniref:CD48 antigen-like n=1 Tax=Erinaceus europaeus TaxID=9365 RepID=A0A1S3A5E0_ERIEU|nr:CD48 antigen-like [Erinaceus europaeus]